MPCMLLFCVLLFSIVLRLFVGYYFGGLISAFAALISFCNFCMVLYLFLVCACVIWFLVVLLLDCFVGCYGACCLLISVVLWLMVCL